MDTKKYVRIVDTPFLDSSIIAVFKRTWPDSPFKEGMICEFQYDVGDSPYGNTIFRDSQMLCVLVKSANKLPRTWDIPVEMCVPYSGLDETMEEIW